MQRTPGRRPGAAENLDQWLDRTRFLDVDVDPDIWPGAQQFFEGRDRLAPADPGLAHLVPGQPRNHAAAVGYPVQLVVVERQQHAVGRGVHIGLEVAVAEVDRLGEGGQRVLQPARSAASMGERDRARMIEESEPGRTVSLAKVAHAARVELPRGILAM
jgi:hypothetical protein